MTAAVGTMHDVYPPPTRPRERGRGMWGMWLFIGTEGMLFVLLFFGYFYLGSSKSQWPMGEDPSIYFALILLGVLFASSITGWWAEHSIKKGHPGGLNIGLGITLLLGAVFLVIQYFEYKNHLRHLTPTENAYGSVFYTITSFHLAHLLLGMGMLFHIFARGLAGHFTKEHHLAVKNSMLYWHFVDVVWFFVVIILYISPQLYGE